MGTSGAFIAVCVTALIEGGAALLVVSLLFQFLLVWRLSWLRRTVTPIVGGTVIMLISVTVMPIGFGMLTQVPPDAPPAAAPVSAVATLALIMGIVMRGRGYRNRRRRGGHPASVVAQWSGHRLSRGAGAVNADGRGNLLFGCSAPSRTPRLHQRRSGRTHGVGARVVGVDYKKGAIVGVSFWIGVGFQHEMIFADRLREW